ncbi:MAG: hypothetical protein R3F31_08840 [Verrucomicrobiales bacterium]
MNFNEKANQIAVLAREEKTLAGARQKAADALKLDPDCVPAMLVMADYCEDDDETEEWYRKAIAVSEIPLAQWLPAGGEALWSTPIAAPYLAAREGLARFLRDCDRISDAIDEFQAILDLQPPDVQEIRHLLLGCLLEENRNQEARQCLNGCPEDPSALWAYGRALLVFRSQAEEAGVDFSQFDDAWTQKQESLLELGEPLDLPQALRKADEILIDAMKNNHWGAIVLLHPSYTLSEPEVVTVTKGTEEEGLSAAQQLVAAYYSNPSSMVWLHAVGFQWLLENGFEEDLEQIQQAEEAEED